MKLLVVVAASVALASEDVMLDEGLSLLQMRAQPHKDAQEPKYYLGAKATSCPPGEDIGYAQCLEAQVKQLIPNVIQAWGLVYNQRSGSVMQTGCFIIGGNIYFSDEPASSRQYWRGGSRKINPICSKSGGLDTYIADSEISCQEADCQHKAPRLHLLNWGDAVVLPELQILEAGATCEACGILSFAQCTKAADMGLVNSLSGKTIDTEPANECSGGGHSRPASPSGCSIGIQHYITRVNFCPYDTPDGQLAGLVSDSGVGVGWSKLRPICGVCTTTSTTTTTTASVIESPLVQRSAEDAYLGAPGASCPPGEDLTYAQCLQAQQVLGIETAAKGMNTWMVVNAQRSQGWSQTACIQVGVNGQVLYSDEPVGADPSTRRRKFMPICSKNGDKAAELARQGMSCQNSACDSPGFHLSNWDDSVALPELQILDAGATCEACGILTYEQCSKANDMGLLDDLAGYKMKHEISIQVSGAGRSRPATPSGCSARQGKASFSPYDTPDGALAGLVSDSGVGVGYSWARPICGVCTTTTTTTEAPKYVLQPVNTVCADDEVITFAQCVEAQKKEMIESTHQDWSIIYNSRGEARYPHGCYKRLGNGQIYYNDEPMGYANSALSPICSKEGGRSAEIAAGLAGVCIESDCSLTAGQPYQILTWGPNVVVPELDIKDFGDVCDPACGLLTYAQCSKAGDMGLIEAIVGKSSLKKEPAASINGAGHDFPTRPSGCTVRANGYFEFNPYDTPDGALAGLVSDSGVSVGFNLVRPVCKACGTTTTATTTTTQPLPTTTTLAPAPITTPAAEAEAQAAASCPCTNGLALTLKTPRYSNLGGAGPDFESPQEILFPEAGVVDGRVVHVKVWTTDPYKGKAEMNGVKGSLGRLNMKTNQENAFQLSVIDADSGAPVQLGALPMTFLDLDEGKKGKGRVSVSTCNSEQFTLNPSELVLSFPEGCAMATSSTKGSARDNPSSVEGALIDSVASRRVVSYVMEATDSGVYSFKFSVAKGFGYRNFLFTLTPGAACSDESAMPAGCEDPLAAQGFL